MKKVIAIISIFSLLIGCTGVKTITEAQRKEMLSWGKETPFEIVSNRAAPTPTAAFNSVANSGLLAPGNSAASISLIGNPNFFKMKGDTIAAHLPYFGERRFGSNIGSIDRGIRFNSKPLEKKISFNAKKQRLEMQFKIKQERDNEIYDIFVSIFANHSTVISINSTERTPISFYGEIKPLE